MISTLENLNSYIQNLHFGETCVIVDADWRVFSWSGKFLDFIQCNDVLGKKISELNSFISKYANEIGRISQQAIADGAATQRVIIKGIDDKVIMVEFKTSPIYNHDELIGMLSIIDTMKVSLHLQMLMSASKIAYFVNSTNAKKINQMNINLTSREEEVLFLLSLGKNNKEIGAILQDVYHSASPKSSTINSIIRNQLHKKFDTNNISALIEKAKACGYIDYIPIIFFDEPA